MHSRHLDAIRVVYACEMVPWKKVLGFKVTVDDKAGTVMMSCEAVIETMYRTYLKGQLTYDAATPPRASLAASECSMAEPSTPFRVASTLHRRTCTRPRSRRRLQ